MRSVGEERWESYLQKVRCTILDTQHSNAVFNPSKRGYYRFATGVATIGFAVRPGTAEPSAIGVTATSTGG
jgi:hypothetical protein